MSLNTVKILGISITTNSRQEILEYLRKYLKKPLFVVRKSPPAGEAGLIERPKPLVIVTPNPEQIVLAQKDKHFADILNGADVAIPDGIGIVVAMRLFGDLLFVNPRLPAGQGYSQNIKRIPGIELMEDLISFAVKEGVRVALIGGRGRVAVEAFERLKMNYPALEGWAEDGPEIKMQQFNYGLSEQYIQEIIKKIKNSKVRLIFVGLGAPKQEYLIEKLRSSLFVIRSNSLARKNESRTNELTSLVLMSVGGSFDIIAGRIKRAPFALRVLGLEWLWRLVREPWRWHRQLALLEFIWLVIREKFIHIPL